MPSQPCPFTDYEEGICFDADDPDFCSHSNDFHLIRSLPSSNMSLTSLEANNRNHSFNSVSTIDEHRHPSEATVLSIEELRHHLNSCFTCGVSWHEDHVSLDCPECGGYSLQRPCLQCDGKCHTVWKRDLTMSHASGKARWSGECGLSIKDTDPSRIVQPITSDNYRNKNF